MSLAVIQFGDGSEAHYSVYVAIAKQQYAVEIEYADGVTGKPARAEVLDADDEGIVICEYTDGSVPLRNATWLVFYDEIKTLTIL